MNQSSINRVLPALRYGVSKRRKMAGGKLGYGRIENIRRTVTALIKYERLETLYTSADEARGYADRVGSHINIKSFDTPNFNFV